MSGGKALNSKKNPKKGILMRSILALVLLLTSTHAFADESKTAAATAEVPLYHRAVFTINLGVEDATEIDYHPASIGTGVGLGWDVGALGNFSRLVPMVGYSYTSYDFLLSDSYDATSYFATLNFRGVCNTGFYFGPKFGEMKIGIQKLFSNIYTSNTYFQYGVFAGYEFFRDAPISFAPEAEINRFSSHNAWKYMLTLNLNVL